MLAQEHPSLSVSRAQLQYPSLVITFAVARPWSFAVSPGKGVVSIILKDACREAEPKGKEDAEEGPEGCKTNCPRFGCPCTLWSSSH